MKDIPDKIADNRQKVTAAQLPSARQIAAGRSQFLLQRAKFRTDHAALDELDKEARKLIEEWDAQFTAYLMMLRRVACAGSEQEASYKQIRQKLMAVPQALKENPLLADLLRKACAGGEFGLLARPALRHLLEAPLPAQALASALAALERDLLSPEAGRNDSRHDRSTGL